MLRSSVTVASVLAALVVGLPSVPGGAHESATGALPATPDPVECSIEPRTLDEIVAIAAEGSAGGDSEAWVGIPVSGEEPFVPPTGAPADDQTIAEITAITREFFACQNAGNGLRQFAIYSDDYIKGRYPGVSRDDLAFLESAPMPRPPGSWATLFSVRDARVLESGQIGAFVEVRDPTSDQPYGEIDFFFFCEQEGHRLIDGFALIAVAGVPEVDMGEGAPAAT